jgi:hypothetical protein
MAGEKKLIRSLQKRSTPFNQNAGFVPVLPTLGLRENAREFRTE